MAVHAQSKPLVTEETLRRVFVTECMGPKADTATMGFCNCTFTKLIGRYGLNNFYQQDVILRASSSKDLSKLANLNWKPEIDSCRSK